MRKHHFRQIERQRRRTVAYGRKKMERNKKDLRRIVIAVVFHLVDIGQGLLAVYEGYGAAKEALRKLRRRY